MGQSRSAADLASKLTRAGSNIRRAQAGVVSDAALIAKREIERTRNAATGGDGRLSNVGKGALLGIRYDVKGSSNPTALVRATGPWQIAENDARPHLIIPRGLGTKTTARRVVDELGARTAFGGSGRRLFQGSRRDLVGSAKAIKEGRGRKAARALTISGLLRGYAFHPGHKGRRPWAKGVDAARPKATAAVTGNRSKLIAAATEPFR